MVVVGVVLMNPQSCFLMQYHMLQYHINAFFYNIFLRTKDFFWKINTFDCFKLVEICALFVAKTSKGNILIPHQRKEKWNCILES